MRDIITHVGYVGKTPQRSAMRNMPSYLMLPDKFLHILHILHSIREIASRYLAQSYILPTSCLHKKGQNGPRHLRTEKEM